MPTTDESLERLFAKVRSLPADRQKLAVEALAEDGVYILSDEEQVVLEPALERATRGEFADEAEV